MSSPPCEHPSIHTCEGKHTQTEHTQVNLDCVCRVCLGSSHKKYSIAAKRQVSRHHWCSSNNFGRGRHYNCNQPTIVQLRPHTHQQASQGDETGGPTPSCAQEQQMQGCMRRHDWLQLVLGPVQQHPVVPVGPHSRRQLGLQTLTTPGVSSSPAPGWQLTSKVCRPPRADMS